MLSARTESSDAVLDRQMIAGAELAYDAAWVVEHHFSDYYPTPRPLLLLSHISGANHSPITAKSARAARDQAAYNAAARQTDVPRRGRPAKQWSKACPAQSAADAHRAFIAGGPAADPGGVG